jgi:hypothetical protein
MSRYDGKPGLLIDLGEPRPHPWRDSKRGTPDGCKVCHQKHYWCAGHVAGSSRPCNGIPMNGTTVCRKHGGKAPQTMAAARRRVQKAEAIEILGALQFAVRKGTTVDQLQVAMEEAAKWADARYRDVEALNGELIVEETDKLGARRLAIHPYVILWTEALDRVHKFSIASAKLGLEDKRLQIAQAQGDLIFGAFTKAIDAAGLDTTQAERMREAFVAELRTQRELVA